MKIGILRYEPNIIHSLLGWITYTLKHPLKGISLLYMRFSYTINRKVSRCWTDPYGFRIDTADKLVSYWAIFIEKELSHKEWVSAIQKLHAPCVIDVGANAGIFIHYINVLNKNVKILAIEPQKCLTDLMAQYASWQKKDNIKLITAACSNKTGKAKLNLSYEGDWSASLSNEICPHSQSTEVPLVKLDDINPYSEIFLLKVDAEGHDLEVLMGGINTIRNTRYLLVEIHPGKCYEDIANLLGENWKSSKLNAINYFFVNKDLV